MEPFAQAHRAQLDALNIPEALYQQLYDRLTTCFRLNDDGEIDKDHLLQQYKDHAAAATPSDSPYGAIFVVPHVLSWDIANHKGMFNELAKLSTASLQTLYKALDEQVWRSDDHDATQTSRETNANAMERLDVMNAILQPATWSRVILYRLQDHRIHAALPAPPYYPQQRGDIYQDADLTGPFPFRYTIVDDDNTAATAIDTSLVYLSPDTRNNPPIIDLVPRHSCPDEATRHVRYAALLGALAPPDAIVTVKRLHAEFALDYHLKRQAMLETNAIAAATASMANDNDAQVAGDNDTILRVYTDTNDPMELGHKEAGLDLNKYQVVDNLEDADIIFSYQSIFAVLSKVHPFLQDTTKTLFVNQFPYEGAFVQKDHLALEVLRQHGLPRPSWSIETYDLDVHLGVFVGAAILAQEQPSTLTGAPPPLWIVKPARGTQSKGHLITRSTAHILRLVDAGIHSWVAQRYIERPVCYRGRKVDCRCIVMLCSANWKPKIYMHKRVYFRIANKVHSIETATDLLDHEAVLTATHLLTTDHRSTDEPLPTLPIDFDTVAELEKSYTGFDWKGAVLPMIHDMIRELFNGMTLGFPGMAEGKHRSRAIYGVDVMFQVEDDDSITAKLTEVTFCPANNAVCDAYERDEKLFRSYNTDVFDCMYRGIVSESITRLQ